jgi:hypothetical protein
LRFEVKRNRLAVVLDPKEAGVTDGARTHDNRNHNQDSNQLQDIESYK